MGRHTLVRTPRTLITLAAVTIAACGGSHTTMPSVTLQVTCTQTTISIYPSSSAGTSTQCHATANGADATQSAQWTSSNAGVASVSAGLVQAAGVGTAQISAAAQGTTASVFVTVSDAFSIFISASKTTGVQGATPISFSVDYGCCKHPTLTVDWGDGKSDTADASTSGGGCSMIDRCIVFQHVYTTAGAFSTTVRASVGSSQPVATPVSVKNMSGTWISTWLNPNTNLRETRIFTLVGGGAFTGNYTHPAGNSEPLTGSVDSSGAVHVRLNGGSITWDSQGLFAAGINADVTAFGVLEKGGSADGVTLDFLRQQ